MLLLYSVENVNFLYHEEEKNVIFELEMYKNACAAGFCHFS